MLNNNNFTKIIKNFNLFFLFIKLNLNSFSRSMDNNAVDIA